MADHCSLCDIRRPIGGTNHLVLNGGKLWIEFCPPCGEKEELTNPETGETLTVKALFDRSQSVTAEDAADVLNAPKPEPIGGPDVTRVFGVSLADVFEEAGV